MAAFASATKGRYYCDHCEGKVSKTLYFTHKQLYYNSATEEWIKSANAIGVSEDESEEDFTFSDSDNGMCTYTVLYNGSMW